MSLLSNKYVVSIPSIVEIVVLNLLYLDYKKNGRGEISVSEFEKLMPNSAHFFNNLTSTDSNRPRAIRKGYLKYDENRKSIILAQEGIDIIEKRFKKRKRSKSLTSRRHRHMSI